MWHLLLNNSLMHILQTTCTGICQHWRCRIQILQLGRGCRFLCCLPSTWMRQLPRGRRLSWTDHRPHPKVELGCTSGPDRAPASDTAPALHVMPCGRLGSPQRSPYSFRVEVSSAQFDDSWKMLIYL